MKLELDSGDARYVIRGYSEQSIIVNDVELHRSVIVLPDALITDWPPQSVAELTMEHIQALAQMNVGLVILGTGRRTQFPSAAVMSPLVRESIGYEVMDTRAACRCYAVLVAEYRSVAAALLPPGAD